MKRILITCITCSLFAALPAEAKKKGGNNKGNRKPKTTTAKVSQIVKQIGENNDGTLTQNQKGVTAAAQGSQFDKWKNPFKMKLDPKLLNRGKKNNRNNRNKRNNNRKKR